MPHHLQPGSHSKPAQGLRLNSYRGIERKEPSGAWGRVCARSADSLEQPIWGKKRPSPIRLQVPCDSFDPALPAAAPALLSHPPPRLLPLSLPLPDPAQEVRGQDLRGRKLPPINMGLICLVFHGACPRAARNRREWLGLVLAVAEKQEEGLL